MTIPSCSKRTIVIFCVITTLYGSLKLAVLKAASLNTPILTTPQWSLSIFSMPMRPQGS